MQRKNKMPKDRDAFVEHPPEEGRPRRVQRISLKVTEEGTIDWDSASDSQKEQFATLVANDPTALEMIGLKAGDGEPEGGFHVKPEHVGMFLDGYAKVQRFLIPKIIERKSKGVVRITPGMAAAAFNFTDEQKEELGPDGAAWANETIPESWRQWLMENVGPGVKFFGSLFVMTMQQTEAAIKMWKESQGQTIDGTANVQPPTNGHAPSETQP